MPPYNPRSLARKLRAASSAEEQTSLLKTHGGVLEGASWSYIECSDVVEALLNIAMTVALVGSHSRRLLAEWTLTCRSHFKTAAGIDAYTASVEILTKLLSSILAAPSQRTGMRRSGPGIIHRAFLIMQQTDTVENAMLRLSTGCQALVVLETVFRDDGTDTYGPAL